MVALVLAASPSLAGPPAAFCLKVTRTIEVLGWTADASSLVWKTVQREGDGDVFEVTHVSSTVTGHVGYATKLSRNMLSAPADLQPAEQWKAWKATHPLVKLSTSPVSPTDPAAKLSVRVGEKPVTLKGNEFTDSTPGASPARFVLGVSSPADIDPRAWGGDARAPGCAHVSGYWSPDGHFVAWLTGIAKEVCGEDPGCPRHCCSEPQVLLLRAR